MRSPYDIIIKPVITERSTMDSMEGKYTFAVDKRATKTEVRQAVEKLFDVRVVKVNTQNISGKMKRLICTQAKRQIGKSDCNDRS